MRKKAKLPEYFWGGLLTSGLSLITGAIQNKKQEEQLKEQQMKASAMSYNSKLKADTISLDNYDQDGYGDVSYYNAKGGKLASPSYMTKGGDLNSISSDMEIAEGNKHNESKIDNTSGIKLYDKGNQQPFAEVEDDEVIKDGEKVYSDQLYTSNGITYAEEAEKIAKEKAKVENKMNGTNDVISKNTAKRQLEILEQKSEKLFQEQEMKKQTENTNTYATGGKFAKAMDLVAPFIDNIGNAILTSKTPKLAKPILQTPVSLNTDVNVNPELQEVQDAVESNTDFIKNNTSNSSVARALIGNTRLQGSRQKAGITSRKANIERELENRNTMINSNIEANNNAKLDNFNARNYERSADIQDRISQNIANVGDDIIGIRNNQKADAYNKERLDIARQMYQSDTTRRAMLNNPSEIQALKDDPNYAREILEVFKGTPEELRLREILRMTLPVKTYENRQLAKIN